MRNGGNRDRSGLHAGCDQLIRRTKGLRTKLFGERLRTSIIKIGDAGEFHSLRRVCLQVAIDPCMIASEGAAANHSNAQQIAAIWHPAIVAHREF